MEKKSDNITLRCTPVLKNRVRSLAEQSHRSVSQQVIYLLEIGIGVVEREGFTMPRAIVFEDGKEDGGLAEW